jgi:hypothetical protein
MDKIYLPFYKRLMVGLSRDRRERYNEIVKIIVEEWKPLVIAPCHGDIIRGEELCRRVLEQHFSM